MAIFLIASFSYEVPTRLEWVEKDAGEYLDRRGGGSWQELVEVKDWSVVPLWVRIGQSGAILWGIIGFVALCTGFTRRK